MKNKIHLIGNAHLDPIWLWRLREGRAEILQTFRSAADRLNEYEEFIFTCSSAAYYEWVEETDPELFEEIKRLVKRRKWVPVNGWRVQPDCNMPSAESFARQALYGQLYYYEKFGITCKTGYNVDSFGHNAMTPQLLVRGGMKYYVFMRPGTHENSALPENLFWWESPDGSRVLTYRIPTGYGQSGADAIRSSLSELGKRAEQTGYDAALFYGVGNHGGGPTKGDIELLLELAKNGSDELKFSSPDEYFESVCAKKLDLPVWRDELQRHASGCYSLNSMIKQLNRKAENRLVSAEKWNVAAALTAGLKNAVKPIGDAWKEVCFNQFHDVLGGCSIREAYDDVRDSMGYALKIAADEENKALIRLTERIDTWLEGVSDAVSANERHYCRNPKYPRPVVVFNPLSFEVETPVRTYNPAKRVVDCEGNDAIFQNVRSSRSNDTHQDVVFLSKLPPFGYAVYWIWDVDSIEYAGYAGPKTEVSAGEAFMENEYLKIRFDEKTGGISSMTTKIDGREYVGGEFCVPTVIDNSKPDAWAHGIFKFDKEIGKMKLASIETVESGPARAVIRVKFVFGRSYLTLDYILAASSRYLRVKCRALWREPLTMLKTAVTVAGENPVSTYEIPGGFIKRPCEGKEDSALEWGDITAGGEADRAGVSIISDSKYSYDCPGNSLRLTLLRNSIFADHYSYRPAADFSYTDEGLHRFELAVYPHTGEAEDSGVQRIAASFNSRPVPIPAGYRKGSEPLRKSFLTVSRPNVSLSALKFCEDGSGDVIMRLNETDGKSVRAFVVCDAANAGFYADFGKFEIKTFRINSEGFVKETNFLEGIVEE